MQAINVKPVRVIGHCRAGLTPDDVFQVHGMRILNPNQSTMCMHAISYMPPTIRQLQKGRKLLAHFTCPDCTRQNRQDCVLFLLGHADKWALCQAISEYEQLCAQHQESLTAHGLREKALQSQGRGEYEVALDEMTAALDLMHQAIGLWKKNGDSH